MAVFDMQSAVKYIEGNSFEGMDFDYPDGIEISGRQFSVARISNYGECQSYEILKKYITDQGGIIRDKAVKGVDYLIVTPSPIKKDRSFVYKNETEKYEKAVGYRRTTGKPIIIRDIDFYIVNDLFPKLTADDKRRVVMEYIDGNPCFTEKTSKKVKTFISAKAKDDPYLHVKNIMEEAVPESDYAEHEIQKLLIPDEQTGLQMSLWEWRKYLSLSEKDYHGTGTGLELKKCKALNHTISIPARIDGKPVFRVAKKAFSNFGTHVSEVILPETVEAVENYTFYKCGSLKKVIIMNPKCDIPLYSFIECPELKEVLVGGKNIVAGYGKKGFYISYIPIRRD